MGRKNDIGQYAPHVGAVCKPTVYPHLISSLKLGFPPFLFMVKRNQKATKIPRSHTSRPDPNGFLRPARKIWFNCTARWLGRKAGEALDCV